MATLDLDQEPTWYIDSATSSHLTSDKSQLSNIESRPTKSSLTTTSGHKLSIVGKGKAIVGDNKTLHNVLYVPTATRNLVSIGKLANDGHIIMFDARSCTVVHSCTPQLIAYSSIRTSTNGLYALHSSRHTAKSCHFTKSESTHLWHYRLGHVNFQRLQHMTTHKLIEGVPASAAPTGVPCETYVLAKQHRSHIPRISLSMTTRPLELIHSDMCGPLPTPSRTGNCYFLTLIDDYSRFNWVHPIAHKSDVFSQFQGF